MATPRHKNGTKTFDQLTFAEGAKTINAAVVYLQRAVKNNVAASRDPIATRRKRIEQIQRLLTRI